MTTLRLLSPSIEQMIAWHEPRDKLSHLSLLQSYSHWQDKEHRGDVAWQEGKVGRRMRGRTISRFTWELGGRIILDATACL